MASVRIKKPPDWTNFEYILNVRNPFWYSNTMVFLFIKGSCDTYVKYISLSGTLDQIGHPCEIHVLFYPLVNDNPSLPPNSVLS